MSPFIPILCGNCKHFIGMIETPQEGPMEADILLGCKAFPKGIPQPIADDEIKHIEPYPGDNGIQYEELEQERKT